MGVNYSIGVIFERDIDNLAEIAEQILDELVIKEDIANGRPDIGKEMAYFNPYEAKLLLNHVIQHSTDYVITWGANGKWLSAPDLIEDCMSLWDHVVNDRNNVLVWSQVEQGMDRTMEWWQLSWELKDEYGNEYREAGKIWNPQTLRWGPIDNSMYEIKVKHRETEFTLHRYDP